MTDTDRLAALLPYIRHGATCALQSVRDNAPWDDLCTCGLRETWAAGVTLDPRPHVADVECAVCGKPSIGSFDLCGDHGRYGGVDLVPRDDDRWYGVLRPAPDAALRKAAQAFMDQEVDWIGDRPYYIYAGRPPIAILAALRAALATTPDSEKKKP